jgi:S-adenosyl methyltransferase
MHARSMTDQASAGRQSAAGQQGRGSVASHRDASPFDDAVAADDAAAVTENRHFVRRAVAFLAGDCGIRQFIDIESGLATRGNVHEIAQKFNPDARVLYVDNDPLVVTHAQSLLADDATTVAINRDLRDPDQILGHRAVRALIDLSAPVAVLLVAVLHVIKEPEVAYDIVERLKVAVAPGSYLVVSHIATDDLLSKAGVARTHREIAQFFDGLELISPGIVSVSSWRAKLPVRKTRILLYAGVGRKLFECEVVH